MHKLLMNSKLRLLSNQCKSAVLSNGKFSSLASLQPLGTYSSNVTNESYAVNMSFATPFADTIAPTVYEIESCRRIEEIKASVSMIDNVVTRLVESNDTHISFSTPYSCTVGPNKYEVDHVSTHNDTVTATAMMVDYSFSSPLSDFKAPTIHEILSEDARLAARDNCPYHRETHSNISFATPYADMMAPTHYEMSTTTNSTTSTEDTSNNTIITYSTPYADIVGHHYHLDNHNLEGSNTSFTDLLLHESSINFSSPELSFITPSQHGYTTSDELNHTAEGTLQLNSMINTKYSYSQIESDFCCQVNS